MMIYKALIPVKSLTEAKSRLDGHLTSDQREQLVLDMLHHVLQVLHDSELLEEVSVVSADSRVLKQAQLWGAQPVLEEMHGHNPALHAAALSILSASQSVGASPASPFPIDGLLTISADLPLLSTHDIETLCKLSKQYQVVLATSRDGTGTNAVLVRPPLAVPYLFGPNSLQRYIQAARQRHLSSTIYRSSGLSLDIDTIDDLHELEVLCCGWQETSGHPQGVPLP